MIGSMYVTMSSVIAGGIFNMIFTKTPFYKQHCTPIDRYKTYRDGKRLFGDNKTWVGFCSMIVLTCIAQVLVGIVLKCFNGEYLSDFYIKHSNTVIYNAMIGAVLGFVYVLFELPNSFIKRRFDVPPGKTVKGFRGCVFYIIDQIDSLIGVMLIPVIVSGSSFSRYVAYILLGGATHIILNLILYAFKVRKNI